MKYIEGGQSIRQVDFSSGTMIPIDKPQDWTSFDVVAKVRNAIKRKYKLPKIKVGHSGTLDPFATGLLLVCTGKATKQLTELTCLDKVYSGVMKFGGVTASYDLTSQVEVITTDYPSISELERIKVQFEGEIQQQVPAFSAVKVNGKRLYKSARAGETPDLPMRKVTIFAFQLLDYENGELHFRIACSKGTYIRSIAHDFGQLLGCGAYLTGLRREAIGEYTLESAWSLEELIFMINDTIPSEP